MGDSSISIPHSRFILPRTAGSVCGAKAGKTFPAFLMGHSANACPLIPLSVAFFAWIVKDLRKIPLYIRKSCIMRSAAPSSVTNNRCG